MSDLPEKIHQLSDRCKAGEDAFDNDDMSLALKFGESLFQRLTRLAEHYERQSKNFMEWDIRGPLMAEAAKAMRGVLERDGKQI